MPMLNTVGASNAVRFSPIDLAGAMDELEACGMNLHINSRAVDTAKACCYSSWVHSRVSAAASSHNLLPGHRPKIACQAKWFVRLAEQAPTGPAESAAQQKSIGAPARGLNHSNTDPLETDPCRAQTSIRSAFRPTCGAGVPAPSAIAEDRWHLGPCLAKVHLNWGRLRPVSVRVAPRWTPRGPGSERCGPGSWWPPASPANVGPSVTLRVLP